MSVLEAFFGWPYGGVWSNLVAAAMWALPAFIWQHRRLVRRLDAHHQALADHITTTAATAPQTGATQ